MFELPGAGRLVVLVADAVLAGPAWPRSPGWLSTAAASPGQRYGLLSDTCAGQYVAPNDLAEGTADRNGNLTIVAPNLGLNPGAPGAWIQVYRLADGTPLGGVQGPLTGNGARTFLSTPPC